MQTNFGYQQHLTSELSSYVKSSIRKQVSQSIIVDSTFICPNFPLTTTQEFLTFNSDLQNDDEFMKQIVSIFKMIIYIN